MRNFLKGIITGMLIGITAVGGLTQAKQLNETAEMFYNDIKITLNGKQVEPKDGNGNVIEPFIIDGTTYLPVRGIASALGIKVDWDASTNTVLLKTDGIMEGAEGYGSSLVTEAIELVKQYQWQSNTRKYTAFIIKNVSTKAISPRIQVSFKKSDGTVVGAYNDSESVLGAGKEMTFICSNDEDFDKCEYILSASGKVYYNEGVSDLKTEVSTTDKKAVIQVTNNGQKVSRFVEYKILFKKGEKVVDYDWGYCTDEDSEIKPSMTEIREAITYKDFDSVEVYVTARQER